ncbi:Response regulator ArlR [Methylobacterium dankookense]|uniref:Response regulator ArlR n=1 Tax=Methylobacterium dankookense TaxID=560405 RepID=A0A564G5Y3_9HYPH|nr:hypothetical protein IFDJLNFL_4576 [Methylobacterium dankookense]VUF15270.1 Response regulator ArlR [Methylobacterium dankookense]
MRRADLLNASVGTVEAFSTKRHQFRTFPFCRSKNSGATTSRGPDCIMRILAVEDDASTLAFLMPGLEHAGHDVVPAHAGLDGLRLAVADMYDALVIDRMLPAPDGLSLVRRSRAQAVQTPIPVPDHDGGRQRPRRRPGGRGRRLPGETLCLRGIARARSCPWAPPAYPARRDRAPGLRPAPRMPAARSWQVELGRSPRGTDPQRDEPREGWADETGIGSGVVRPCTTRQAPWRFLRHSARVERTGSPGVQETDFDLFSWRDRADGP